MEKYDIKIRIMEYSELDKAFNLIWNVFKEFVAPDYTQEGIDNFHTEFILGKRFREKFTVGNEVMYGAYIEDEILAGALSLSVNNTVSCIFVDGQYHRLGIGKKLFDTVKQEMRRRGAAAIKLNASPYALPFYHNIGFEDIGEQAIYKGIVYTPMGLTL